jgi:hypothetical protein
MSAKIIKRICLAACTALLLSTLGTKLQAQGINPFGIVASGDSIWVTNSGSNTVTWLRVTDGTILGNFAVGKQPNSMVIEPGIPQSSTASGSDATLTSSQTEPAIVKFQPCPCIWISNYGDNTVTKLSAQTGAFQAVYGTGGVGPTSLAFDGSNVWVTNYTSNTLTRLSASGTLQATYSLTGPPTGLTFDGANIWVANSIPQSYYYTLTKIQVSTGAVLAVFTPLQFNISFLFYAGNSIWALPGYGGYANIAKLDPSNGATLAFYNAGPNAASATSDGTNLWVVNEDALTSSHSTVTKVVQSTGSVIGTYGVGSLPTSAAFVNFTYICVVNSYDGTVTVLQASTGQFVATYRV